MVEEHEDGFTLQVSETDICRVGQPILTVAINLSVRARAKDFVLETITQCFDLGGVLYQSTQGQFRSHAHGNNSGDVFRTGSSVFLLVPTDNERRQRQAATDVQRADTFRRVKLVAGDRQQIDRTVFHINGELPGQLNGVHMKRNLLRFYDFSNLSNRKDHSRLIVCGHDRNQSGVVG